MGAKASKKIPKLSKEDQEYLRANTNYSVDTIIEWYKGFMEDCPDGKLTPHSFMHIYGNSFLTGNAKEFCDHVFRTFDRDQNGFIDFKEFLLAIHVTSSGTPEDKLNWAFSMYDVDGSGWIDLGEMTRIVKSIFRMSGPGQRKQAAALGESAEERASSIFRRMDQNSDGKVTRMEFVSTCLD